MKNRLRDFDVNRTGQSFVLTAVTDELVVLHILDARHDGSGFSTQAFVLCLDKVGWHAISVCGLDHSLVVYPTVEKAVQALLS